MLKISLCMIIYNEEKYIRRCLGSVREFADEIIIVDTGSTDQSKSICEECGAWVFDYNWTDNFSEARNYGISKASGDWILLLDGDEEIIFHNPVGLKQYLQNTAYDLVPIRITHFYGEKPADEKRAHFSCALRLARNDGAARVNGGVYERIDADGKNIGQAADTRRFVEILHYGYMEETAGDKQERNIGLLLKEKERQTDDPWLSYYLAAEYYRAGQLEEAYREINTTIIHFLSKRIKPPALAYKLKYALLIGLSRYEEAYSGIEKAVALYPDYVDLHLYKGILQYKQGECGKARDTFRYCLLLGETNMEYLILSGSGSFLPLYYIGLCHEKQGQAEQAAEAFRQAEAICPVIGSAGVGFLIT